MARSKKRAQIAPAEFHANDWSSLISLKKKLEGALTSERDEILWFRGVTDSSFELTPTLMRYTDGLNENRHDAIERDLFFEFQAKSPDLKIRNLSDWDYLFYSRHHDVPTRLLDWTDTLGVAIYFALEEIIDAEVKGKKWPERPPAIWILNPYALNRRTWEIDEVVSPRYLGLRGNKEWDFGELLDEDNKYWEWDGPVAVYPIQLSERVRAQRGWFTIHGNNRWALEAQLPKFVSKIILKEQCIKDGLLFLECAGFNKFSIYPDYDSLAIWLTQKNMPTAKPKRSR
jgi:hypothetical protein